MVDSGVVPEPSPCDVADPCQKHRISDLFPFETAVSYQGENEKGGDREKYPVLGGDRPLPVLFAAPFGLAGFSFGDRHYWAPWQKFSMRALVASA
ncbi:MAG: hypothetical protein AAGF75_01550 [Cyanobacteria bacterium P01_H01_bin.130]